MELISVIDHKSIKACHIIAVDTHTPCCISRIKGLQYQPVQEGKSCPALDHLQTWALFILSENPTHIFWEDKTSASRRATLNSIPN